MKIIIISFVILLIILLVLLAFLQTVNMDLMPFSKQRS